MPISRREECPHCHKDAKVCLNCRFYDSSVHHECKETQAEWVKDKEKGNFCGYFFPISSLPSETTDTERTKSELEKLFGNSSSNFNKSPNLNSLFKDHSNQKTEEASSKLEDELKNFIKNKS